MSLAVILTIVRLEQIPAVTDIVGANISPDTADAAEHSIALDLVSDTPYEGLAASSGHSKARVTVKLRSRDYPTMHALSLAVFAALSRYKGTVRGRRCSWMKAGADITRWADDASVCEQMTDWYVTYGPEA